ncbi:MAG: DUF547 domain-containing protein [Gammaproteobacteria bacterium]|nr:DUF547 domain-containing protein [Gammaproteobacteria bacterium]
MLALLALSGEAAQPEAWSSHDADSAATVDHSVWQTLLDTYLLAPHSSGINRFRYGAVSAADRERLRDYIAGLAAVDPRRLNRAEQQAYWINLYNAVTVGLVVDNYPVASIRRVKGGLLRTGPWDEPVVTVLDVTLSLNDIEHGILRPVYRDPRIHYAINCASLGCPNLAPRAYTGTTLDADLDAAARGFVNAPRGVLLTSSVLRLSAIYDWFAADFGPDQAGLLRHLQRYADPQLAAQLADFSGAVEYAYDWALNDP